MKPNRLGPHRPFKAVEYGDVCDLVDVDLLAYVDAENVAQVADVAEPLDISDVMRVVDVADVTAGDDLAVMKKDEGVMKKATG